MTTEHELAPFGVEAALERTERTSAERDAAWPLALARRAVGRMWRLLSRRPCTGCRALVRDDAQLARRLLLGRLSLRDGGEPLRRQHDAVRTAAQPRVGCLDPHRERVACLELWQAGQLVLRPR